MKHILIDFENIKPDAAQLSALDDSCHIWLFLGAQQINQQKLFSADLCEALCRFGKNVHFLRLSKQGNNALDFYLSYYLGRITERDSEALICILSRDGGYDVLVDHLRQNGLCKGIGRLSNLEEIAREGGRLPEILPKEVERGGKEELTGKTEFIAYCKKTMASLLPTGSFRPKLRRNLQLRLENLILADEMQPYSEDERQQITDAVIERFLSKGLLVENEGLLDYCLDEEALREKLVQALLKAQPKTLEKAKNVLVAGINSWSLPFDNDEVGQIIEQCRHRGIIHIGNNNKINYPTLGEAERLVDKSCKIEPAELSEAVENCIKRYRTLPNKPKTKRTLINSLKAQLQSLKPKDKALEVLLDELVQRRMIRFDGVKVQYLS